MRVLTLTVIACCVLLQACGTPYATQKNKHGEDVMLLGHDPVAYFTLGKSMRGDPAIKATLAEPARIYYFMSEEHKQLFLAMPEKYEPQYGGFCSSGAAFALKLGSDPTEWQMLDGKLYLFGDVLGHEAWKLDPAWNVRHGDEVWPEARLRGWRGQSLKRYINRVPWYQNSADISRDFAAKYPGREWPKYDVGSMFANLFTQQPGWRARSGFGPQPVVGFVGEDPCPPACPRTESKSYGAQ